MRANYLGSYANNQVTPPQPVASWTTLDATLVVPLDQTLAGLGGRARLELNVENALNRDPPHVQTPRVPDGYDPVLANALGRVIALRFVVRL
jgi:outer membrane receptor protein involved in Fe transport